MYKNKSRLLNNWANHQLVMSLCHCSCQFWWVPGGSVRPHPPPHYRTLNGTCGITLGQNHSDLSPPPPARLCTEASSVGGVVGWWGRDSGPTSAPHERQTGCATICFSERGGDGGMVRKKKGREEGADVPLTGIWEVLLGSSTGNYT